MSDRSLSWKQAIERHHALVKDPAIASHVLVPEDDEFTRLDLESRATLRRYIQEQHVEAALVELKAAVIAADDDELHDMRVFFETWAQAWVLVFPEQACGRERRP